MIYKFGIVKPNKPDYIEFIYDKFENKYRLITTKEINKENLIYKITPEFFYVSPIKDRAFYYINNNHVEIDITCIDVNNIFKFRYFDTFISYSDEPNCYKVHKENGTFELFAKRDIDCGELLSVEYNLDNI